MEQDMGYKQPFLDEKVNDMKEIAEEEWIRLSKYLHQLEPEVQSLEKVLTWKNPRHSMAVFFIINSVFLWYSNTMGQRIFIISLTTISLSFSLPQFEKKMTNRIHLGLKEFYNQVLSRLDNEEALFDIDKISQRLIHCKEIIIEYFRSRDVQPLKFWTVLIASTSAVYFLAYHIARKLLIGYVLCMTLFFAPYIVHHRVLMRLANYLPKVIDQFNQVNTSQDGESSIFGVDSNELCKETDDQIMSSSCVSIGDFIPPGLDSINNESSIGEASKAQNVDNTLMELQLSQQSDIGSPDLDSLHEFYPTIDSNDEDGNNKSNLRTDEREKLTKEALDPETDSLLDFYPAGLDHVDSAKVHKLETHKEVVKDNGSANDENDQMTQSYSSDTSDFVIVEHVNDQEISDSYQPIISQGLFPFITTITVAQPPNPSLEPVDSHTQESTDSLARNSSFSISGNYTNTSATPILSNIHTSVENDRANENIQMTNANDEFEVIKHSDVCNE